MIMGIQASRSFDDYEVFKRAMGNVLVEIEKNKDEHLYIYTAGPSKLNSMAIGFANITEESLKAQGVKIQVRKVPPQWFEEYMSDVDFFAYFCWKHETPSRLVKLADSMGMDPYVYNYSHAK